MANLQSALFYPFTYLYVILDFSTALNFNLLIHTILACIFMVAFSRSLGISKAGSALAAVAFAFNGYFLMHYAFPSNFNAYVWIPLICLFIKKTCRTRSIAYLIYASLAFSFQIFAGHPQFVFYTAIAVLIFALFTVETTHAFSRIKYFLLIGSSLFLLTALMTAVQLIPTFQLLMESSRTSGLGYDWATTYSLNPIEFLKMIYIPLWNHAFMPASGDPHIVSIYFGVPLLFFSLCSIQLMKKDWMPFALIAIVGVLFSLGRYLPFYRFFYDHVWPMGWIKFPAQWLYLTCFGMACCAGWGMDRLPLSSGMKWLLVLLCSCDLWFFFQKGVVTIDPTFYKTITPNVAYLKKTADASRIILTPRTRSISVRSGKSQLDAWLKFHDSLYPNLAMVHGLYDAHGIEEVSYRRYDQVLEEISKNHFSRWLDLLGVRYILSFWKLPEEKFRLAGASSILTYKNLHALPKAYFAPNALELEDTKILAYVAGHPQHDFSRTVLVEKVPELTVGQLFSTVQLSTLAPPPVHTVRYLPNRVTLEHNTLVAGWVVLGDTFDKGWSATVNGKKTEVVQANYVQRAVFVEPGYNLIEFFYKPRRFNAAAAISLLSLLLTCSILVFCRRKDSI